MSVNNKTETMIFYPNDYYFTSYLWFVGILDVLYFIDGKL